MANHKKKILLFTDWYLPGFKAGGPIQSCRNIVKALNEQYQFYIFTSDRDLGESRPYPGIQTNTWTNTTVGEGEQIFYAAPDFLKVGNMGTMVRKIQPDIVYFNSMFSQQFTLMPLWMLKQIRYTGKITLAPRGMLHSGALMQKSLKKRVFLHLFKLSGWPGRIVFHATDDQERKDIIKFFPQAKYIQIAENIPNTDEHPVLNRQKQAGELRMIFISRIHAKKNLHFLLEILQSGSYNGMIWLDVYGVEDDPEYVKQCRQLAASTPSNIQISFAGPLLHKKVFESLHGYHLFVLPTLGENFGHAIFESLSSGTPVLISDQTPWRKLENAFAGWDLPLEQPAAYKSVIDDLLTMDDRAYAHWSAGARAYAENFLANFDFVAKYHSLFQ